MAVRVQACGRVLVVTIDNPQVKNAFDQGVIGELRELFETLAYRDPLSGDGDRAPDVGPDGQDRPHVIVLRATGDVFCAGANLNEMKALGEADFQTNLTAALDMGAMFRAVRNCPVPVIARVQGPAYGGGVGLVAACDLVVAGPRARFAFTEVKLGLVPGVIAPLVVDRIGRAAARRCFLTAEVIEGQEALRMGLIDRLVADPADAENGHTALDALVAETVDSVLRGGPEALGLAKALLEGVQALGYNRSAELSARMIAQARTGAEAQVALAAFFAKDPVPWAETTPWVLPPESGAGQLNDDSDQGSD